jgi:CHAT domain-containing protein
MAKKFHLLRSKFTVLLLLILSLTISLDIHILPTYPGFARTLGNSPQISKPLPTPDSTLPTDPLQQGKASYQAGKFTDAVQNLTQAVQIYDSQGNRLNQAMALNYLSLAEQKLGNWDKAASAISIALKLLNQLKQNNDDAKRIWALTYNTQGSLQLGQGKADVAVESWEKAAEIYAQIEDKAGRLGALINQTMALQSLGLYGRTMKISQEIKKSLDTQEDSLLKAVGLRSLGNAKRVSGDLKQSQELLEKSLTVANKLKSPQEESATLLSLGNTILALGNRMIPQDTTTQSNKTQEYFQPSRCLEKPITEQANIYYNKAKEYYQQSAIKSTSKTIALQAKLNYLRVLEELKQTPSKEEISTIESSLATLNPSRSVIYAGVNFARSLSCLETREKDSKLSTNTNIKLVETQDRIKQEKIINLLNRAVQQAKELKDTRAGSFALGSLGQVYEESKQWSTARKYTEAALNLAQIMNAADIAYQWEWQLGRLLLAEGNTESAIASYSIAIENLKSLRTDLVALNPDIQFDFRDEVEPVYRQLVTLLLKSEKPTAKNLKSARNVLEALQLAELDNFFRDACSTVQATPIDEVVDNANPATAVIYPIILPNSVELIVKLPRKKELHHYRTEAPKAEVEKTLDNLVVNLKRRYTFREVEKYSQKVYNWVIKPAEADLQKSQVKTLVFVLDGSLRNIPMAALYDGRQYIIDKYSLAVSPGLQLVEPKQENRKFIALTAGLTKARQGFSALPNVAKELQSIESIINSKKLIDQAFTNSRVKESVNSVPFPVVHLATHGKFSSQFSDTFILAWDDKINVKQLEDLLKSREQVVGRESRVPKPIELLVLSACETATGDRRAALGLAGVAVRSGARSTLASLWQVDDKSTATLMSEFYRQLTNNPSITKSEALRRAQSYVLHNYEEHPFYWSAYVLVGNWL